MNLRGWLRRLFAAPATTSAAAPAEALRLPEGKSHFYELDAAERERLVARAAAGRRTLVARWAHLEREQTDAWALRARAAAELLGPCRAVADIGCGMMTLEQYLPPGTGYIPVDVVARDARTRVVDLNAEPLPALPADALAGLGLLEYLYDVGALLARIAAHYPRAVLSYNTLEAVPDRAVRTGHAWVNHYTRDELEALMRAAGLRIEERREIDATQTLWKLAGAPR